MRITKENLHNAVFENENARLLILDAVSHTAVNLYYYYDVEITERQALNIWYKAYELEGYSVSFLDGEYIIGEYDMELNKLDWKSKNRCLNSMINPLRLDHSRLPVRSGSPQPEISCRY